MASLKNLSVFDTSLFLLERPSLLFYLLYFFLHAFKSLFELHRRVEIRHELPLMTFVHLTQVLYRMRQCKQLRIVVCPVANSLNSGFVVEPSYPLSILPEAVPETLSLWSLVGSEPMLLASAPVAYVDATISPLVNSEAVLLVFFVLAFVASAVAPLVATHAVHVVVAPLTLVAAAVKPGVDSEAVDLVLEPFAFVVRAVIPLVEADTFFLTFVITTEVGTSVHPFLVAVPMLQVIFPLALVKSSILMLINSVTTSSVHPPLSVVDVPFCVHEPSLPTGPVKRPVANVLRSVRPAHGSEAVSEIAYPLAFVDTACLVLVGWPLFSLACWVILL